MQRFFRDVKRHNQWYIRLHHQTQLQLYLTILYSVLTGQPSIPEGSVSEVLGVDIHHAAAGDGGWGGVLQISHLSPHQTHTHTTESELLAKLSGQLKHIE